MTNATDSRTYVLITPARNEEAYIEKTIQSVISQTILPEKWVIVSDGSTDRTDEIVNKYAAEYGFMQLVRTSEENQRNFGSKVNAFNAGYESLRNIEYDFLGNLDADVSFVPNYYERLLKKFQYDPNLGLAGGIISELIGKKYIPQRISLNSVAGAIQLFRYKCYEEIGGYIPINSGGIDSAAEIMARMHGWKVQTFPEIKVLHHRRVATGEFNILKARFRQGMTDFLCGYHPLFQIMKCLYRIVDKPYFIGSMFTLCGYFWASFKRYKRPVTHDVVKYLRSEQVERMRSAFYKVINKSIQ